MDELCNNTNILRLYFEIAFSIFPLITAISLQFTLRVVIICYYIRHLLMIPCNSGDITLDVTLTEE